MDWKLPTNRLKVVACARVVAFAAGHDGQGQGVQRVDVRGGGLVGRFYAASDASGRTGVLMLGGSGGGYPDEAAARDLARAGYPVLALAYFRDYGGDPAELEQRQLRNVPLEYIFEALDWLQARPEVRAHRIVLMGESRGAALRPSSSLALTDTSCCWPRKRMKCGQAPAWRTTLKHAFARIAFRIASRMFSTRMQAIC